MTEARANRGRICWLHLLRGGPVCTPWRLAALSFIALMQVGLAVADEPRNMNLARALAQERESAPVEPDQRVTTEVQRDDTGTQLQLARALSPLRQWVEPELEGAGALAQTPKLASIFKFGFWFALLLLVLLAKRDVFLLFRRLLSPPPLPPASMPYAPWPSITAVMESTSAANIETGLAALAAADYPQDRLKILVLCPLHRPDVFAVIQKAADVMPGRVVPLPIGYRGDVAGRCFSAGIRCGNGELVLVISDATACPPKAIKACAERFFDPSIGALLGFLPSAGPDDRALAPRMANLLRVASQTAGLTSTAGMTPGTGLLAVRRASVRTSGMDLHRPTNCFALLRQMERMGSRHCLQEGITAAGEAVHNWDTRSRWIGHAARVFASSMSLNPLSLFAGSRALPVSFGMRDKLFLPVLWCSVALGSIVLYFCGSPHAAAFGLAVCAATAYGVDARPAAFNCTAVLFRVRGRRAEASLVAWAPVMFFHDISISASAAFCALIRRALRCLWHGRRQPAASPLSEESTPA